MTTAQALPRAATRGKWTRFRSSLFQDYWALVAVAFLALVVLAAIAAPLLVSGDVNKPDYGVRLKPPLTAGHPLGTDQLGRDVLDRLILGSRISVTVGFASVVIAGVIGTLIGIIAAYYGGWIDSVLMRLADVQLSFPFILLALVINAIIGLGLRNIIITLVIAGWVEYARIARGEILALREREFVEAARVVGAGERADHAAPPAPEHPDADHRDQHAPGGTLHRRRGEHQLPRLRCAAAHPRLGEHDQ